MYYINKFRLNLIDIDKPAGQTTPTDTDSFNYNVFYNLREVNLASGDDIEYLI